MNPLGKYHSHVCIFCNKGYLNPDFYERAGRCLNYCSKDCYSKSRWTTKECSQCRKEFKRRLCATPQSYCSKKCAGAARSHNKLSNWRQYWWAKKVKERDGSCRMCGSTNFLEAHHVVSIWLDPQLGLDINNGIALCHDCHKNTESYGHGVINIGSKSVKIKGRLGLLPSGEVEIAIDNPICLDPLISLINSGERLEVCITQ